MKHAIIYTIIALGLAIAGYFITEQLFLLWFLFIGFRRSGKENDL